MANDTSTTVEVPKSDVKPNFQTSVQEEKQVIVHCSISCEPGMGVRIWKTTYLVTEEGKKVPLLFWDGVSLAPNWTLISASGMFGFTLIFGGLPSSCNHFSLVEEIPEPGGFEVRKIRRNKTDVYSVTI